MVAVLPLAASVHVEANVRNEAPVSVAFVKVAAIADVLVSRCDPDEPPGAVLPVSKRPVVPLNLLTQKNKPWVWTRLQQNMLEIDTVMSSSLFMLIT